MNKTENFYWGLGSAHVPTILKTSYGININNVMFDNNRLKKKERILNEIDKIMQIIDSDLSTIIYDFVETKSDIQLNKAVKNHEVIKVNKFLRNVNRNIYRVIDCFGNIIPVLNIDNGEQLECYIVSDLLPPGTLIKNIAIDNSGLFKTVKFTVRDPRIDRKYVINKLIDFKGFINNL